MTNKVEEISADDIQEAYESGAADMRNAAHKACSKISSNRKPSKYHSGFYDGVLRCLSTLGDLTIPERAAPEEPAPVVYDSERMINDYLDTTGGYRGADETLRQMMRKAEAHGADEAMAGLTTEVDTYCGEEATAPITKAETYLRGEPLHYVDTVTQGDEEFTFSVGDYERKDSGEDSYGEEKALFSIGGAESLSPGPGVTQVTKGLRESITHAIDESRGHATLIAHLSNKMRGLSRFLETARRELDPLAGNVSLKYYADDGTKYVMANPNRSTHTKE
ncbi:MAG: hypothetical protein DRQ40_05355 [Gammaproteobacteria bacterium]|nr:MAG: hypothetical protein DRQ40_05355 [Gammaproteobacteria bacterium]